MKTLSLLASLVLVTALTTTAMADPVGKLRELDRLLEDGRISKQEYDRRWNEVISQGTSAPSPTSSPSVPKLDFKRPEPPRPPNEFSISGGAGTIEVGDNLQLSIGADYARANSDDSSLTALGALGAIDYHFNPTARFVPYLGIGAAYTRVQIDDDSDYDWCWNAHVGLKQTIRPDTAIKYQVTYFDHADFDIQGIGASIGISFLF
jgi:opacity protein-like surface antigen